MNKILGINYSGFHDTSIVLTSTSGEIKFASSLERVSREKQDGRLPGQLLDEIDFNEISDIAISANRTFEKRVYSSLVHPQKLLRIRDLNFAHKQGFYDFIETLPGKEVHFIDHELSHASSAFYLSGFDEAVCLVYDGGMYNSNIFGGVYQCSKDNGITLLDGFDINQYAKITTLYSVITAVLGFTPNKHEGKITGLAAFGKYDEKCQDKLKDLFSKQYDALESTLEWLFQYSDEISPVLFKHTPKLKKIQKTLQDFTDETIAYNLQYFTEQHILKILEAMNTQGWLHTNICLAGGLFANVKVNQKISEFISFSFENIFVAPPMGDDGTALGAAFEVVSSKYRLNVKEQDMYLGHSYSDQEIKELVQSLNIKHKVLDNPSKEIAQLLVNNEEVALFSGKMEFGPRSLGARSILAPANNAQINTTINTKLHRTEFMPFAPMTLEEYLDDSYINIQNKRLAMKYMTISCECTQWMKNNMPAVVHIDNTARPQIITKENGFVYQMMHEYNKMSGFPSIVNTSFNIHEEPIVNTPSEAIKGFLTSGLAYLYFQEANILISYEENCKMALETLKDTLGQKSSREIKNINILEYLENKINQNMDEMEKKEIVIEDMKKDRDHYLKEMEKKEIVIEDMKKEINRLVEIQNRYDQNKYIKIFKKLGLIR